VESLPAESEREALVAALADLMADQGSEPFLAAPILEPTDRFFPDRWEPSARGVHTLARRLLRYAGLGQLRVEVSTGDYMSEGEDVSGPFGSVQRTHHGAAGWFAGIHDGVCVFGADVAQLQRPEGMAGLMAHEVAHAYRALHALVEEDRDLEERLTDLTTVYLGFGVLTVNASHRYRASGEVVGGHTLTRYSHERLGYLSPQAMSFLLGAQVVARALPGGERRRLAGLLETNQASFFRTATRLLETGDLRERLPLPIILPTPRSPDVGPLPPDDLPDAPEALVPARPAPNEGRPVFRIARTRAARGAGIGVLVMMCVGVPVALAAESAAVGLASPIAVVVGALVGRLRRRDVCADPTCEAEISREATICPGCGGTVRGRLRSARDRLAAAESLEDGD
jgi:hypothetical protein